MTKQDLTAWQKHNHAFDSQVGQKTFGTALEQKIEIPYLLCTLRDIKNIKILELGCGQGEFSNILTNLGAKVTALDGSKQHIQQAKLLYPQINFSSFDINKKLPFPPRAFNHVVSRFVLMYIKDLNQLSKNIYQIIKPRGVFIFSVIHPFYPYTFKLAGKNSRYRSFKFYSQTARGAIKMGGKLFPYYFRPIEEYVNPFIKLGFGLKDINEVYADSKFISKSRGLKRMKNKPVFMILTFER